MNKSWIALAVLCCSPNLQAASSYRSVAPSYSASSIVSAGSFAPGVLAPNSIATIFGSDLAYGRMQAGTGVATAGLPFELAGVTVSIAGYAAPLFYVSETQINFLVPNWLRPGDVKIRVSRQGVAGPEVPLKLADVAPSLFRLAGDIAIAAHTSGAAITEDAPARPGEVIVLYAAGLGMTNPDLPQLEAPRAALLIRRAKDLRVLLNGVPVDAGRILYAGVTPGSFGLYQINVILPGDIGTDPEVRLAFGDVVSEAGTKLLVRDGTLLLPAAYLK